MAQCTDDGGQVFDQVGPLSEWVAGIKAEADKKQAAIEREAAEQEAARQKEAQDVAEQAARRDREARLRL